LSGIDPLLDAFLLLDLSLLNLGVIHILGSRGQRGGGKYANYQADSENFIGFAH